MPLAMTARVLSLALGCLLATPVGAGAQAFFTATPSPDLRIAPLTIRAAVTPACSSIENVERRCRGSTRVTTVPCSPARAVRPARCR